MKNYIILLGAFFSFLSLFSQQVLMNEVALPQQVYGEVQQSEGLLPMNDLGIQSGYVLYQATIEAISDNPVLEIENVRDYASVYIDNQFQGELVGNNNKLELHVVAGKYTLALYAENIGRITYGPEILDNSKGLFGSVTLDGEAIEGWAMTVLDVRDCPVKNLKFMTNHLSPVPGFYKGTFAFADPDNIYLDMSGWGMGEVWINGEYQGAYWEKSPQKTIQIDPAILKKEKNEIVVFDLKYMGEKIVNMISAPLFK